MATASASAELAPRRLRFRLPERLPDLKGQWLTLYTMVWAILLPISIAGGVLGAGPFFAMPAMFTPYGIATEETARGVEVTSVVAPQAQLAGVRVGDLVVAVDGWQVPRVAGRLEAGHRVMKTDGAVTRFTMKRPGGQSYDIRLVRSETQDEQRFSDAGVSWPAARALNVSGAILLPLLFISAAILLFARRRREAVPALLSLAFLIFGTIVNGGDPFQLGVTFSSIASTIGTLCLWAALLAFPSGRFEPRWTAIPFLLLVPLALIDPDGGAGTLVGGFFMFSCLAALVSRYWRVGEGAERMQLRWAFLGLFVGLCLTALSLAGDAATEARQAEDPRWLVWRYALFQLFGVWGLGVMALGLIVSILRYRLYDADAVIGRSAAYALLTIGFVALFAASQEIIELMGEEYFGRNVGALAGGIGAALAAVAIAPMHARAQRWAERRFQPALNRLRNGLPLLAGDLRETSGVEQIAAATLDALIDGVHTSRAAMIANGAVIEARKIAAPEVEDWWRGWTPTLHDGMNCDRADPLFPIRMPLEAEGHGRIGWLLLGARPDGSMIGKTDRDVIEEIAEPVARAVQVALRRDAREAAYRQSFEAIERRLQSIERRIPNHS